MVKARRVIFIQLVIIIVLIIAIIVLIFHSNQSLSSKQLYCQKHLNDKGRCFVSPRVYADITPAGSQLALNLDPLKTDLQDYISENQLNISLYVENLRDGASFGIGANQAYPAASLNKLSIALLVLKKIEEEKSVNLDTILPIAESDRDPYSGNLYANPAKTLSIRELLYYMLSQSDNTALNVLEGLLTKEDINNLEDYVNFYTNNITTEGNNFNVTLSSPKTVSNMFISLYLSTVLEARDSELILSDLANSSFDIESYAGLPKDMMISQKDGFYYDGNEKYFHDCGIIYQGDSKFLYCIMTKDINVDKAPGVIGILVNKTYNFIIEQDKIAGSDV